MKHILIVDDEILFTKSLAEGLSTLEPGWQILMANNGQVALGLLEENQVQLVVTDLKMPVMDGFQLLAHLATHHSELPVIVMSAFATPEMEEKLQSLGIDQILEKPLDLVTFHEKVRSTLESSAKGFIRGITLPTFLQMIGMEKKTCTISVKSGEKSGTLYFREGKLFDAEAGDLSGVMAAINLLSWEETGIEIRNACKVGKRVIQADLQYLLLESMRIKDEEPQREAGQLKHGTAQDLRGPALSVEAHRVDSLGLNFRGLEQFKDLEGLLGLAVLNGEGKVRMTWPAGREESLALTADLGCKIAMASDQACQKMDVGRSLLAHFEAEGGHILIKELHGSYSPKDADPEFRSFLLLVMDPDCQLGLARMKILAFSEQEVQI